MSRNALYSLVFTIIPYTSCQNKCQAHSAQSNWGSNAAKSCCIWFGCGAKGLAFGKVVLGMVTMQQLSPRHHSYFMFEVSACSFSAAQDDLAS